MTAAWAIATRELRSFFRVPAGWVIVALYLFLTGIVFSLGTLQPGSPATLRDFFGASGLLLMVVAPAVSMRLFSEELRSGTAEALLTAPVGDLAIVVGKYLGGVLFLVVLLAPTLVYPVILALVSDPRPDAGPIAAGYLALLLLGLYFLGVGTLASALTNNQTLAYLGAMLALVVLTLVTGQAAERAPAPVSEWLFALSVTRRMGDFAKGVIDLGHVVFLLSLAAWFLTLTHAVLDFEEVAMIRWRKAAASGALVAAVTASMVLVNVIAGRVAPRIDVTATGEHRLAPRTARLIERLEGEYEIVAAVNRAAVEPNAYRQVRDVLDALDAANPLVRTTGIDTGRADGLERYQELVERLVERDRGTLDAYRTRADDAIGAARGVAAFLARQVAPSLERLRDAIPDSAPSAAVNREAFGQRAEVARLASRELDQLADQAEKLLDQPGAVPRPDRAGAVVLPGLDGVGSQLAALADELAGFAASESQPEEARAIAGALAPSAGATRDGAAAAVDALRHAERPDVLRVADALGQTDAVLVIGPDGLTAIDLGVLFPTALELEAMGLGTGDVRGRAEELFATALGSLALPARPIVVLVHGEDRPILDATHAYDYLRRRLGIRGIDLVEWPCVVDPEPPALTALDPAGDRPVVYTTLTPDSGASSGGMNGVERAQRFADTLQSLIDRGEPLLLNLNVSVLPSYGTDDPVAGVLERLGLAADLGRPLLSARVTARGRLVETDHVVRSLEADHPIAGALLGLNTKLTWPVPINVQDSGAAVLYEVGDGWAESEWVRLRRTPREQRPLLPDPPEFDAGRDDDDAPWAVVVAGERAHESGTQRFVVVGSNDWAVDPVAAEAVAVDGVARPANPGNAELFEAAVSWLAGQDDLIAESVSARVVPTVRGLSDARLAGVRWLVIAGLPGLVLATGIAWRVIRG